MPTLTTQRLILRPLQDDDFDAFAQIVADPEVQRFMASGPLSRAHAWRQLAIFLGHDALRGYSQNAVVERDTGRLVGRAGPGCGGPRAGQGSRSGGCSPATSGAAATPRRPGRPGGTGRSTCWAPMT